jgi:hypothetical protein
MIWIKKVVVYWKAAIQHKEKPLGPRAEGLVFVSSITGENA